jgi:phenylpyruvate tautomerase PptA (4-oxalocrotonate tautomerase family)
MPFVEVFSTPGTPRPEQRKQIAERLVAEVMVAEGAPDNEFARAISWLVWHDIAAWSIGGQVASADEPPRYVVRVSVPAASLTDAKREEIVRGVTRVLADADDEPERLYTSIASFVLIDEVPEGNWGGIGRVVRFNEISSYVMTGAPGGFDESSARQMVTAGGEWKEAQR